MIKTNALNDHLFKVIIQQLPYPVVIFSKTGEVHYVNPMFVELFGFEKKDISSSDDWWNKVYLGIDDKKERPVDICQWKEAGYSSSHEPQCQVACRDGSTKEVIVNFIDLADGFFCLIFNDVTESVQNQSELKESEERFRALYKRTPVPGFLWQWKDGDFELIDYNLSAYKMTNGNIPKALGFRGQTYFSDVPHVLEDIRQCYEKKSGVKNEYAYRLRTTDEELYVAAYCEFLPSNLVSLFHVDITKHINIEKALRRSERKLDMEARRLEEANVALNVLLDHRDEEKMRIQEDVMYSLSKLITPFFKKLKETKLTREQMSLLGTIESNLNEITAPFAGNLSYRLASLTSTEMEVAALVKDGKRIKQIANDMCISEGAVSFHRKNIRAKLGLKHKKINLHTFLQQMTKR